MTWLSKAIGVYPVSLAAGLVEFFLKAEHELDSTYS